MSTRPKIIAGAAILATLFAVSPAAADNAGETGKLVGIQINQSSSDVYPTYRGQFSVVADKVIQDYRWSGSFCSGKSLTEHEIDVLHRSIGNPRLRITPYWKNGLVGSRCVVSFVIAEKKYIDDLGQ